MKIILFLSILIGLISNLYSQEFSQKELLDYIGAMLEQNNQNNSTLEQSGYYDSIYQVAENLYDLEYYDSSYIYLKSHFIFSDAKSRKIGDIYRDMGHHYLMKNDIDIAYDCFRRSIYTYLNIDSYFNAGETLIEIAEYEYNQQQYFNALRRLMFPLSNSIIVSSDEEYYKDLRLEAKRLFYNCLREIEFKTPKKTANRTLTTFYEYENRIGLERCEVELNPSVYPEKMHFNDFIYLIDYSEFKNTFTPKDIKRSMEVGRKTEYSFEEIILAGILMSKGIYDEDELYANGLVALGAVESSRGFYKTSNELFIKSLDYSREFEDPNLALSTHLLISDNYEAIGDIELAYDYVNIYINQYDYHTPISNYDGFSLDSNKQVNDYSFLKAEKRKIELQAEKNRKKNYLVFALLVSALSLGVISILVYRNYIIKKKLAASNKRESERMGKLAKLRKTQLLDVNHRTRDHLGLLISFIEDSIPALTNNDSKELAKEEILKIRSIQTIHDLLGNPDDFSLSEFLSSLIYFLKEFSKSNHKPIQFKENIEPELHLPSRYALSFGLIVNECITNSIKHAFPNSMNEGNIISITLQNLGENLTRLHIADNGIGFSENKFVELREDSLGLQLISDSIEDLRATFSIASENGTKYIIDFKV